MKTNLRKFLFCHLSCLFLFLPISANSSLHSELGSSRPTHEDSSLQSGCRLGLDNLYRVTNADGERVIIELAELTKYSCQMPRDMTAVNAAYEQRSSDVETETAFFWDTPRGGTATGVANTCREAAVKAAGKCASRRGRIYISSPGAGACAVHVRCS